MHRPPPRARGTQSPGRARALPHTPAATTGRWQALPQAGQGRGTAKVCQVVGRPGPGPLPAEPRGRDLPGKGEPLMTGPREAPTSLCRASLRPARRRWVPPARSPGREPAHHPRPRERPPRPDSVGGGRHLALASSSPGGTVGERGTVGNHRSSHPLPPSRACALTGLGPRR